MVVFEEDTVNQVCVCTLDKLKEPLTIRKARDGFIFFEIVTAKGKLASELSGKFSSIPAAKKAIEAYDREKAYVSKAVRSEKFIEERLKRKEKENNAPVFEPESN